MGFCFLANRVFKLHFRARASECGRLFFTWLICPAGRHSLFLLTHVVAHAHGVPSFLPCRAPPVVWEAAAPLLPKLLVAASDVGHALVSCARCLAFDCRTNLCASCVVGGRVTRCAKHHAVHGHQHGVKHVRWQAAHAGKRDGGWTLPRYQHASSSIFDTCVIACNLDMRQVWVLRDS